MKDFYSIIAPWYDKVFSAKDYEKEALFLDQVFKKFGNEVKTILDVGCGTLNHGIFLEKLGYKIDACDNSKSLLKIAKEKKSKIRVFQCDMRNLKSGEKYDGIICMTSAFRHMLTDNDIKQTLICANSLLKHGGIYIIDVSNSSNMIKTKHFWPQCFFKKGGIKVFTLSWNEPDFDNNIQKTKWVYFIEKNGKFIFDFDETEMRMLYPNEMKKYLKKAKFKVLKIFGEYNTKAKYKKYKSPRMIFVCKKNQ